MARALLSLLVLAGCQCGPKLMGSESELSFDPAVIDFGRVRVGTVTSQEVVVRVMGRSTVEIARVTLEQPESRPFASTAAPRALGPGDEARFFVEFSPTAEGSFTGAVGFETDRGPQHLSLTGIGFMEACSPRTSCLELEGTTPQCGTQPDGCGGTIGCGSCAAGSTCASHRCVPLPVDAGAPDAGTVDAGTFDAGAPRDAGGCAPRSCTAAGASCGSISDGCGGTVSCGVCASGAGCQQNQCVCAAGAIEVCGDGVDNTCDGNSDCADPQCSALAACAQPACTLTSELQVTSSPSNAWGAFLLSTSAGWAVVTHEDTGHVAMRYSLTRLSPTATIAGSGPITSVGVAHRPFAAWSGSEIGLAWSDVSQGMTGTNDVYFTRVSSAGQRMMASDLAISVRPGMAFPASVAWNPAASEYGVLWADSQPMPPAGSDRGLLFRRVNAQGVLMGAEVALVPPAPGLTTDYSDLVWGGGNYGIVATQIRPGNVPFMLFNRLSAIGTPELSDLQLNAAGRPAYQPHLTSSPTQYGVVFEEYLSSSTVQSDVVFARADKQGPANATRTVVTTSHSSKQPSVLWAGGKWIVAFADSRSGVSRIYVARFAADGSRLGSDELASCVTGAARFPHLATDGARVGLVFIADQGTTPQAFFKTFTP